MKLNEVLSVESSEKGLFILKLENPCLNLETLQQIPLGLEKIKHFNNINGIVLYAEKLLGPSFHDFNLYIQKEELLTNYIDSGESCISSFKNLPLPFCVYIEKYIQDTPIEFLLEIPRVSFSKKAVLKWNYSQLPIFPIFGTLGKFLDKFGIKKFIEIFIKGENFYLSNLISGRVIPQNFFLEGILDFLKKSPKIKEKKESVIIKKAKDLFEWKKMKKFLELEVFNFLEEILSLYFKEKLTRENEEILIRNYFKREKIQNKLKYLMAQEEIYKNEVLEGVPKIKKFLSLGLSLRGIEILERGLKKKIIIKIIEENPEILKENLKLLPKDKFFSFATRYYGFARYPLIFENLNLKEEGKNEKINSIINEYDINSILIVSLKTTNLKTIEKKYPHPTKILGYHIPKYLPEKPFVEIIKGSRTSQESLKIVCKFFASLGYFPIVVNDKPGFLVLRILSEILNEAFYLLEEGFPPSILEKSFKTHGFLKGPFQLGDENGFSDLSNVAQILSLTNKDFPVNKIFSILAELEKFERRFPIKFYLYKGGKILKENKKLLKHLGLKFKKIDYSNEVINEISERFLVRLVNSSFLAIEGEVVEWHDKVDLALSFLMGTFSSNLGILKHCDYLGWNYILNIMNKLSSKYGQRYQPCKSIIELCSSF